MGTTLHTAFATWLRAHLQTQPSSVSDFAAQVGVRPATIYRWTAGQRLPATAQVAAIAAALGVATEVVWTELIRDGLSPAPTAPPITPLAQPRSVDTVRYPAFASWLRAEIVARGWSARELARRLDLDVATPNAWLKGHRTPASVHLTDLAALLGVEVARIHQAIQR